MLALLFVCILIGWHSSNIPVITIKAEKSVIFRGEELEELNVIASCKGDSDIILDYHEKYTLQNLIDDLNSGLGYSLKTNVDVQKEGIYEINIELDQALKEKLENDWRIHVRYELVDGVVEVRNETGTWEGAKFKKYDGTYAANEFVSSNGDDYYFDGNGEMVTGEYAINNKVYYFSEEGVFDTEKNKIHPGKPMIALTFDDGPGAYTDQLLSTLEEYNARATFFMLGNNVRKYPDVVKRMEEIGCELGNHTNSHANLTKIKEKEILSEINKTNQAITDILGHGTELVRPPYGAVNDAVKKNVKYPLIFWSVDTTDWERQNAKSIAEYVLKTVQDGDIVLMHDIHEYTVEAALMLIPELAERGYQFVTVSEMAEVHGAKLQDGVKYFNFY